MPVAPRRHSILLLAFADWAAAHNLCRNLDASGFDVGAIYPPGHVLGHTRFLKRRLQLPSTYRWATLVWAADDKLSGPKLLRLLANRAARRLAALFMREVESEQPLLIFPLDERAIRFCDDLLAGCVGPVATPVRALLERSMGRVETINQRTSRVGNYEAALAAGVRVPRQLDLSEPADWRAFVDELGYPVVFKEENTAGGSGVRICHDEAAVEDAIEQGVRYFSGWHAKLGRANMAGTVERGAYPGISIQQHVRGTPAMSEVLSWNGKAVAGFSLVKEKNYPHPNGAGSIVRSIQHRVITEATAKLVAKFGLNGFADADFMIDDVTDEAFCIELNARPTGLSHLGARLGCSLEQALHDVLHDMPVRSGNEAPVGERNAIFPKEWWRDPSSPVLKTPIHDVPWDDPKVITFYAD